MTFSNQHRCVSLIAHNNSPAHTSSTSSNLQGYHHLDMLRSAIIAFATLNLISNAALIPRPRPQTPDRPSSPSNPKISPNGPGKSPGGRPGGFDNLSDIPFPSQEDIESNMGDLELELQVNGNATAGGSLTEVVEVVLEIVSAILADPDCGRDDTLSERSFTLGTSTKCKSPACKHSVHSFYANGYQSQTVSPTRTVPSASFTACTSFANVLSGCNSATPSFYFLAPTAQASCVCYDQSLLQENLECARASEGILTQTATAMFDLSRFDDQVNSCQQYFSTQGYKGIANGLDGLQGSTPVLGAGFCKNLDADVKSKTNGTVGLFPQLTTEWQKRCPGNVPAHKVSSEAKDLVPTRFNRGVLVSAL
jgi:hypothetical protein